MVKKTRTKIKYRQHGVVTVMTNGQFNFRPQPRVKAQSTLIKKLAHGRLSATKDGAIQLTIKVRWDDNVDPLKIIKKEAKTIFSL